MTYSWAIIVVLVAIGALAYFGVLSPDLFVPNKCSLPKGITCLDYNVETSRVILVLQNNLGENIIKLLILMLIVFSRSNILYIK